MKVELTSQPDNAKIWVYLSNKPFNESELNEISSVGDFFLNQWESHQIPVKGSIDVLHNQFIVFSAYSGEDSMCGRAQSAQMNMAKEFEEMFNISLTDRMLIAYRDGEAVKTVHFNDFPGLIKSGQISIETLVFNNLVDSKSKFESEWEVPIKDSWHNQFV